MFKNFQKSVDTQKLLWDSAITHGNTKHKNMRTKTLLIAAAAMAAGLVTSQAQVYSQNVVGYVNLALSNGFNLVSCPLHSDTTGTNDTVDSVFGTQLPGGSFVYAFSAGAYASPAAGYSTKGGWGGGTNAVNAALSAGGGVFVKVPSAVTVTIVGNVMQGTNLTTHYDAGFNIVSSQVPQGGLLQTDLGYTPTSGDFVYVFDPATQSYISPASGYSTKGGWSSEPNLSVGQAVFLKSASPTGGNWVRNFTVQ